MIKFNGIDLQDLVPVKIDDIKVSPIALSPVSRQRIGFGQDLVRMDGANRTVSITFALLEQDREERFKMLQQIVDWANPYKQCVLSLPMYEGKRHLECVCTGYPEPSYRQWWESKLRLTFTTYDNPYWTSDEEIRASCNVPFSIGGTAPPLIRIERSTNTSGPVANQTYYSNRRSMTFSRIPSGKLVIDLNRQTAEVGGTSIMQYFTKTSKFILPVTGNITITGTGTIIYRERWV